jgi:thiol-disulfide isomerase/thioredoxin
MMRSRTAALAAIVLMAAGGTADASGTRRAFPDFEARALDGSLQSAGRHRGKVVLIDFWASWCGPCRAEVPGLVDIYQRYHEQGFEIVGINLDDDMEALQEFLADNDIDWPQVTDGMDGESGLADRYGVDGIPDTILIDRAGRVYARGLRGEELEAAIAALIGPASSRGR